MTSVELRDVTLTTGGAIRVAGVSAHARGGRLVAIVGANGSGKSSLLSLMAGRVSPTSGQVLLGGLPVGALTPTVRARQLAWLGQTTPGADSFAVRDVVDWGRISHSKSEATTALPPSEAIERVGLAHLSDAPMGSLSGGERQRAHLARVWVQAAPITLLDEPDANLDDAGRTLLRHLVTERVQRGDAIVIVTHDRGWANSAADEVWQMDAGRLIAH